MYKQIARPLLFRMDPESAHHLTTVTAQSVCRIPLLGRLLTERWNAPPSVLSHSLLGIRFSSPVGIAAGFDKNGHLSRMLRLLGFGYAEYGSITARPSQGNPRPRLFRLPDDAALINRLGLNNQGAEHICSELARRKHNEPWLYRRLPAGINIAKTHDPTITGDAAIEDYLQSYRHAQPVADYITLNISCPNTREGKTFEDQQALRELLSALGQVRKPTDCPLLVKFSPDTEPALLSVLLEECELFGVDGYVISNTSSQRQGLQASSEQLQHIGNGGLSGAPLFERSLAAVRLLRNELPARRLIVGCGGIDSPEKALSMLNAGAELLQLYTGLVYEGPGLVRAIHTHLVRTIADTGFGNMTDWMRAGAPRSALP